MGPIAQIFPFALKTWASRSRSSAGAWQIAAGSEIRSPARRSTTDVISKTCSRVARATKPGRLSSAYGITGNLSGVDRKSVVLGKSVSVRVDFGGARIIKKKKLKNY